MTDRLRAQLYDATHRGLPGDRTFYRSQCPPHLSVLELGCGSGRILKSLAPRPGHLVGVELDAAHRSLAIDALGDAAEIILGDLRTFQDGRRFHRVLLPFNGLFCLESDDDVIAAFETARHHLTPGGEFLLDVYPTEALEADAAYIGDDDCVEEMAEYLMDIVLDGQTFEVFEESRWFPAQRRYEAEFIYASQGTALTMTIVHFYRSLDAIESLASEAGMTLIEARRGFGDSADEDDAEEAQLVLRFGVDEPHLPG